MKLPKAPGLESRRAADFEREFSKRAHAWLPSWSLDGSEPDFGLALLRIAARFSAEVGERLDRAGEKMALGFLDWLGMRAEAARPARMPVAFKLAETARDPVTAPRPVKMQVDAAGSTVTFETETDIRVVPGTLDMVIGVDPANDAYYLPPPGLSSLEPLEPLPTQWLLKNFAAPGSTLLQLDPGLGLSEGMLIEIEGAQYEIRKAKDDLVTIEPGVPEGGGLDSGTPARKVTAFYPFDGASRNRQEHILYIGDSDLLDVEAAATIQVIGLPALGEGVAWEYWGKDDKAAAEDSDPRWRAFESAEQDGAGTVGLAKPKGSIEPTQIGPAEARWIRARLTKSEAMVAADGVELCINPRKNKDEPPPALNDPALRSLLPPVEVIVNTTPSPSSNFYVLGREPRLFDTLYLGSAEAFSKPGATAWVQFDLSDGVFNAMATFDGFMVGKVLAGVDKSGALHLFSIGANGELERLAGRQPLQPNPQDASGNARADGTGIRLTSSGLRPAMWREGFGMSVAVVAKDQIWVWTEAPPFLGRTGWQSWGTVPAVDDPNAPVDGLVAIKDGSATALVALRGGQLFKCNDSANPDWDPLDPSLATNEEVVGIAGIRAEALGVVPDRLLLIAEKTTTSKCALYSVTADGTATSLLSNIVKDVTPFGMQRAAGGVEVAAVEAGTPRKLLARSGATTSTGDVDPVELAAGTSIDGHVEAGALVLYCNAVPASGASVLLAWLPFDAKLKTIVFQGLSDPAGSNPGSPIAVGQAHAFLPGRGAGEVLVAALGHRFRLLAGANTFKSALALSLPAPAIAQGDAVIAKSGPTGFERTTVAGALPATGVDSLGGTAVFWLDRWIDLDTQLRDVWIFPSSVTTQQADLLSSTASTSKLQLASPLADGTALIVAVGTGEEIVEIVSIDAGDPLKVTVRPKLSAGISPPPLDYRAATVNLQGQILPSLKLDPSNNNWAMNLLGSADLYFPGLDPVRQHPVAIAPDPADLNRPQWIALKAAWNGAPGPTDFVVDAVLSGWRSTGADSSSNPELAWEYWNGTGWWRLQTDEEGTGHFRNSGTVRFVVPDDLQPVDWAGKTNHWVRARLIGGDYGREKVVVVTEQLGGGKTEQTVNRTTEGIQPPYALDVRIAYAVDESIAPAVLLTWDSGTLRDQSDANRTRGAEIEVFTPLGVALARFEAAAGEATGEGETAAACVPDCDCPHGTASMSQARAAATPAAPLDSETPPPLGRPALYLGFNAKLLGEPINVLLSVLREAAYDRIAPLRVDALIGNRFVPLVAADETRALGETGLIKMAFSAEPTKAELFGRTLAWVRLTPSGAGAEWKPSLAGAYLNAVWARSAETMTRELIGSSSGQPDMTLALARPPVLRGSLELRVREPLGAEERDALGAQSPGFVKSDVEDLPGDWVLWSQVDDPLYCGTLDRVYALDEATGTIRFGDGRHGMIPPVGADSIVAFSYERADAGSGGIVPANFVAARTELNLVTAVESVETVWAADRSAGGVATETADRVLQFAPARLRHRGRAVSAHDFEELVWQRSAEVVQARCFVGNGRVRLVVVMRGKDPAPSQAQKRELKRMLLGLAPPTLASPGALTIEGPRVRRLRVALRLRVATLDVAGAVADEVKTRLSAYFNSERGGDLHDGWPLGASPREDDVAQALLDVEALESIMSIELVEVDEEDRERPWPASIGSRELAMLADEGVRIGFDVLEAVE